MKYVLISSLMHEECLAAMVIIIYGYNYGCKWTLITIGNINWLYWLMIITIGNIIF